MTRVPVLLSLLAALAAPVAADESWDPLDPPVSADPAGEALAENDAECAGAAEVREGFVQQADVDGDGANDAILDWGALRCDEGTRFCGSGGCRMDVWLSRPDNTWRLLLRERAHEVHAPVPGALVVLVDSEECDPPISRLCFRAYDAWGGTLMPLGPERP